MESSNHENLYPSIRHSRRRCLRSRRRPFPRLAGPSIANACLVTRCPPGVCATLRGGVLRCCEFPHACFVPLPLPPFLQRLVLVIYPACLVFETPNSGAHPNQSCGRPCVVGWSVGLGQTTQKRPRKVVIGLTRRSQGRLVRLTKAVPTMDSACKRGIMPTFLYVQTPSIACRPTRWIAPPGPPFMPTSV